MSLTTTERSLLDGSQVADGQERLDAIVAMMREMSLQSDPEAMVRAYGARLRKLLPSDRFIALSRRGLEPPRYRITRSSLWTDPINPWREKHRLPLLEGGLLAELIYGDEPRIITDLAVDPADPAAPYFEGMRSLMAIPNYDAGVALNMTITLSARTAYFDPAILPDWTWMSNLFGRATNTLVLKEELRQAYEIVDRELNAVADMQRSLLPSTLPRIPNLSLAADYQTSRWAGGDYYDIFALPDGRWGLWIADVSGHGTPAAVMMAITHAVAHAYPGPPDPPGRFLEHINRKLNERYTSHTEAFVTAFYGIFDPPSRTLTYACAGHNPPRLKRCSDGSIASIDGVGGLPLGLFAETSYPQETFALRPGDQVIFYTDGVTDATDPAGRMFGLDRLDEALYRCQEDAHGLIAAVLGALDRFTAGHPPEDDRTLLVARVS
jgi:sigma-B regulation protein RsbU (phosphoserine phosphatase)